MRRIAKTVGLYLWALGVVLAAAAMPVGADAQQTAKVLATCGSAGYSAGTVNYVTQDTTGAACGSGGGGGGGGAVFGPTAVGSPAANPPVLTGGTANALATGTVQVNKVDSGGDQFVNLAEINGAAPSITNPIWIANAEAADTSGTFTNATQTTSITNTNADGYATGLLSINGTYGTASGVFEESDDGGTTYYSVICTRSDGSATETGYTSLTNTNRQWSCPVAGNDTVRIRSTAVASGTVNVRVGISTPTNNSGVVSGAVALNAGSANVGNLNPATHGQCSALCSNSVLKNTAGVLNSFEVSADATLAGAIWYVMVFDAASLPADGAVTPAKCYQQPSGTTQMGGTLGPGGVTFGTGIVIGVSTTGCFSKTASTHAFIAGDFQ